MYSTCSLFLCVNNITLYADFQNFRKRMVLFCIIEIYVSLILLFFWLSDLTEPKGQLLLIDGKTEDEVRRSLERVLLTMTITTSEPKVQFYVALSISD